MAAARQDLPSCMQCRHHVITHDESLPYACQAMGFKSRRSPQREVLEASGQPCLAYEPRLPRQEGGR